MHLSAVNTKPIVPLKPVAKISVTTEVMEKIKGYIVDNDLAPGSMLPYEAELISALNVGKSTLKQAIKSLEAIGILEVKAGKGIFVANFDYSNLARHLSFSVAKNLTNREHLVNARWTLEAGAMAILIKKGANTELIAELRRQIGRFRNAKSYKEFVDMDFKFHRTLIEATKNPFLVEFGSLLTEFFANIPDYSKSLKEIDFDYQTTSHGSIVEALEKGDFADFINMMSAQLGGWKKINTR